MSRAVRADEDRSLPARYGFSLEFTVRTVLNAQDSSPSHLIATRCLFDLFTRHLHIGTLDKKSAPGTTFPFVVTAKIGMFFALLSPPIFEQSRGMQLG